MPTITITPTPIPATDLGNETEIDFFGTDLMFTDDVQLSAAGDYSVLIGTEALRQAIRYRLITAPGEYAVRPDYGCGIRNFVKKRTTQAELDLMRQTIIAQLTQDDRIEKVNDVILTRFVQNNVPGVKVVVKITAIGRENSFDFSFSE